MNSKEEKNNYLEMIRNDRDNESSDCSREIELNFSSSSQYKKPDNIKVVRHGSEYNSNESENEIEAPDRENSEESYYKQEFKLYKKKNEKEDDRHTKEVEFFFDLKEAKKPTHRNTI